MTLERLPADGEGILFMSPSPNPHRRSLNGSRATIISRKQLDPSSPVYDRYTDHVAVEIKWDTDHNLATTWADLNELHLPPDLEAA